MEYSPYVDLFSWQGRNQSTTTTDELLFEVT